MAVATTLDVTKDFNADSLANIDMSGWDSATVQLVSPTGTINFLSSNDSGAVESATDGNALTSASYTAIQGTNLATGTAVTSLAASGLVIFKSFGRYLQLSATSVTATKVLVYLSKIG